jgi:hypothetical protein
MSQADIDIFVDSAHDGTLTPHYVTTAVVTKGVPVNGRHSRNGFTALHWAVRFERRELVVALLADGVDANVKNNVGATSVRLGAANSSADILQLLVDSGGSVNEPTSCGGRPLIALAKYNRGDTAARLQVLLACPELDLDAACQGKMAEMWAVTRGHPELAAAIAEERVRRKRWSALRLMWIAAVAATTVTP